jgi:hypothetical protein
MPAPRHVGGKAGVTSRFLPAWGFRRGERCHIGTHGGEPSATAAREGTAA